MDDDVSDLEVDQTDKRAENEASRVPSPLREDLIANAVGFLSHPKVRTAASSQKMSFLRKKGLNEGEIEEAFKRVGNTATQTAAAAWPAQGAIPLAAPEPLHSRHHSEAAGRSLTELPTRRQSSVSWWQSGTSFAAFNLLSVSFGALLTLGVRSYWNYVSSSESQASEVSPPQ